LNAAWQLTLRVDPKLLLARCTLVVAHAGPVAGHRKRLLRA
jgi:hypothetical protein